jgi:hypothetical protein
MQKMPWFLVISLLMKLIFSASLGLMSIAHAASTESQITKHSSATPLAFQEHCGGLLSDTDQASHSQNSSHGASDCHECCTMGLLRASVPQSLMKPPLPPAHKPIAWLNSAPQRHLRPPISLNS